MRGGVVGADADAVDAAARQLEQAADEFDGSASALAKSLGGLSWLGGVAIRFSDHWHSTMQPRVATTAAFLREAARELHLQAAEQRSASADRWSTSGSGRAVPNLPTTLPPIPTNASPQDVRNWWMSLTPEQRAALVESQPGRIGNLDGVPFAERDKANHLAMQRLLDSETSADGPIHRRLRQFTDMTGEIDKDRHFLVFDPSADGKVAEVFGDLEHADYVTVVVPGVTSDLESFHRVSGNARVVQDAAGKNTAVIAWIGYDAPDSIPDVAEVWTGPGIEGGKALASFVAAVQAESGAKVILTGHSYGSYVVGQALLAGARVESAVFIGSPGAGVERVADFPPGAAQHYYAGAIPLDPVAGLQAFGQAPTDPDFGATVFDAGRGADVLHRHSQYFDEGVGRDNIVRIASGGSPSIARPGVLDRLGEAADDAFIDRPRHIAENVVDVGGKVVNTASNVSKWVSRGVGGVGHRLTEWAR